MSIVIEEKKETSRGEVVVRITCPAPPPVSKQMLEKLPMSMEELLIEVYRPLVGGLARFIAGIELSGELGPLVAIPLLERKLSEAAAEMSATIEAMQALENAPPKMPNLN